MLDGVMQEDKLFLECAAKKYPRRMSVIWTNALIFRPKSCDRVKLVLLAGAWSSYVDATLADNGYTGDRQKSSKDCY